MLNEIECTHGDKVSPAEIPNKENLDPMAHFEAVIASATKLALDNLNTKGLERVFPLRFLALKHLQNS